MLEKHRWLHVAELIDRYRVFPRAVLIAYGWYVYQVTFFILNWYAHEPKEARGIEESTVVGVVVTAVTGFAPMIYKIYAQSSQPWDQTPVATTSTMTATKVVTPQ